MQQSTFSRKPKKPASEAQENKAAGSLFAFLKPLGSGAGSKGQQAAAPSVTAAAAGPSRPLQQLPAQQPAAAGKPPASRPAAVGSKLKSCFGFQSATLSDTSEEEEQDNDSRTAAPAAAAQRKAKQQQQRPPQLAAAATVAARGTSSKPNMQQLASSLQRMLAQPDDDTDGFGSSGSESDRGLAAGSKPGPHKAADSSQGDESNEVGGAESDGLPSEEDSLPLERQQRQRQLVAGSASASDWAPESDDSASEDESDESGGGSPSPLPAARRARSQQRKAAATAPAKLAGSKAAAAAPLGGSSGGRPNKAAATAAASAAARAAAPVTKVGAKRKQAGSEDEGKDQGVELFAADEGAEDPTAVDDAGIKAKRSAAGRKRSKAHLAALPLILPAAVAKQREPAQLLCELPGHLLCLEGDSGTIGRVALAAPPPGAAAAAEMGEEMAFQLDLKGILYATELAPMPMDIALVRLKPSGDEMVVEQLFPAVLRCQPQEDFMQENADLLREMEAYDSDRHCADSEQEGNDKAGSKPAQKKKRGRAGQKKAGGGRATGGGGGRKAAAPRKHTPAAAAAAGGTKATAASKPGAKAAVEKLLGTTAARKKSAQDVLAQGPSGW